MKIENPNEYSPIYVDGAYVNSLVELVNNCRVVGVKINTVQTFLNGWRVTFEDFEGDAICHDRSYGSPCSPNGAFVNPDNDWYASGMWETIGFPWDNDDVSVHTAFELADLLYELKEGR